jgi:DNA-binding SARP family transcriptional activator
VSLLIGLAWAHQERGDYGSAIRVLRKVTREEPANEEAHVGLMRLHALSGRQAEALRHYESLEERISRQVGTGPSASTRALGEEIASGRFPPEVTRPRPTIERSIGATPALTFLLRGPALWAEDANSPRSRGPSP